MQINVNVYVYLSFLSFEVTTASQGLCLFVVLSCVFPLFHLVIIVNYCHRCHECQKSSLPGDTTAACSSALQSHFLLNILPRSCPRNLLKSIRACICVSFVVKMFALVFVFVFSQVDRSHFLLNILPLTVPAICRRVVYPSLSSTAELKPGWKQ